MTHPDTAPQPLALAQQRIAFDELLRDRVRAMLVLADPQTGHATEAEREVASDDAALVDAQARHFAEQVDRENDARQRVAGAGHPVMRYEQAVLIEGEGAPVVVTATEYDATPAYWQTMAGGHIEQLVRGADLVEFLRTGNGPGIEQLGLA